MTDTTTNTTLILAKAIQEFLRAGNAESVRVVLRDQHPADIANILAGLETGPAITVLRMLSPVDQACTFGYLPLEQQVAIARAIGRRDLVDLIRNMESDERADLYNRLSEEEQEALLPGLAQAERDDIRKLAAYREGTAGAIMTSDYATLTAGLTTAQAIAKLRREAPDKETIYEAYVVDADRRLVGAVSLQDLILADPAAVIGAIMRHDVPFARVEDDQAEVARLIARYDAIALPVVNGGDKLVGIVTYDDAMDVAEQEATEDFHRHGSMAAMAVSMKDATIATLYRKRVFWLVVLVFGNIFSGAGIAYFEDTIAAYVALVFFLPLLIDSGGNAGSQAATLMVRALATGEVVMRDWTRMLGREVMVAAGLGVTMAVAVSLLGLYRGGTEIALVVALTMVLVVVVGSVIGMSLPFLLSRFRFDPATASGPLITSIADAAGVIIYFTIATSILLPDAAT